MKFVYKAKKGLNEIVEGTVEAPNEDHALNNLTTQGLFPVSLKKADQKPEEAVAQSHGPFSQVKLSKKGIRSSDILLFTQNLLTLLRSKVALLSALNTIYEQNENARLKEIILHVYNDVKEGKTFSESLEAFPKVFSPLYVNMVKAGEATGMLDHSFKQITIYLARDEALKTKIKVALAYPVLLLVLGFCSIFVLITFVVPKLKPIFESERNDLPTLTKVVFGLSEFAQEHWMWFFIAAIIVYALIYMRKGSSFFPTLARNLGMKIPLIKKIINNKELVNFSSSLSLLLNSGVPALSSLEISSRILDNQLLKEQMKKVYLEISAGQGLAKSMGEYTGLPRFFIKMLSVGEETGRLGEVLDEISFSCNQQLEADLAVVSALIEPILILFLGLVIGTIVLAVLLPTFQITQSVH
jgi:type II secretory pathway component PulF